MEIISQVTARRRLALITSSVVTFLLSTGLVVIDPDKSIIFGGQAFSIEPVVLVWLLRALLLYAVINFAISFNDDVSQYIARWKGNIDSMAKNLENVQNRLPKEDRFVLHMEDGTCRPIVIDDAIPGLLKSVRDENKMLQRTFRIAGWNLVFRFWCWELTLPLIASIIAFVSTY